jgi:iron(II)-dependent oxidoreductase
MQGLDDKHFELPATELIEMVTDAHERTVQCVADLDDAQLTVPLREIVNPFVWELGHVAFFYDVFLLRLLEGSDPVMEGSDDLYNSFTVDHDNRWSLPLPSREETLDYMRHVMQLVVERLNSNQPSAAETYLYLLAVHHEDMHDEAFTYMRQTLGYPEPVFADSGTGAMPEASGGGPLPGDVDVPAAGFQLGAAPDAPFVFDNEKWAHPVELPAFQIARAPVTNAEFAAFVDDGGYLRRELWSTQGWVWRAKIGAQGPIHWRRGERGWLRRDFDKMVPIEEHAPVVHVNWYEAEAYCNWAGRRLPTEAEWEMAASAAPADAGKGSTEYKSRYPWGNEQPTPDRANLDSHFMGCVDVGAFAAGDSAFGCRQMIGNVWEWTASPFYPFPGYVVDFPYREYSAPWFGYRQVLKGGAWATRSHLAYNTHRNFFQPYRNDLFAGFRTCATG